MGRGGTDLLRAFLWRKWAAVSHARQRGGTAAGDRCVGSYQGAPPASAALYVLSTQSPTPLKEVEAKPLVPPLPWAALNHPLHGICGTSRHGMARYLQGAWKSQEQGRLFSNCKES